MLNLNELGFEQDEIELIRMTAKMFNASSVTVKERVNDTAKNKDNE